MLCACALAGIYYDWRFRRLPNTLSMITLIGGIAYTAVAFGLAGLTNSLAHFAIAAVGAIALHAAGWIGGGDVKFYAAVASWFQLGYALQLFCLVVVTGGVLGLVWILIGMSRRPASSGAGHVQRKSLPYGVAIAVGAIATWILTITGHFALL